MIELKNLHKYFNKGSDNEIHVINDVTLSLPASGMVAVFGKSGCGKTTLLNVIGGLDRFDGGSLTVDGKDICANTDETRNRYIGYIFQNYNLHATETCYENVAAALRLCGMTDEAEIATRVRAALRNVDMEKYEKRPPDTLSGGQQQRIAIARAIVKNPRIILADEPTGNLDEANTVMIMDLLKKISRDHLVLLVTHEAELVDYYCDTVIELSDGAIVSVRENKGTGGYVARGKNDIYLGELSKTDYTVGGAEIEYYGELPPSPVKLKIVNHGGKLYCRFDTTGVQVLDDSSETKLREGVFAREVRQREVEEGIDMSALPPVEGARHGKLFHFISSVKSGFRANFQRNKRSKKVLVSCLCLFAAALVVMSAVFGTAFGALAEARSAYNHQVFYVYTMDAAVSAKLHAATPQESGIDGLRLSFEFPDGDGIVWFNPGNFETFGDAYYYSGYSTNAVYLGADLAKDLPVVVGKGEIGEGQMLITTAVADALLESSTLGYITAYRDLIGLVCTNFSINGENLRVAGVVASDESAIYLSELSMARYVLGGMTDRIALAADFGVTVETGEVFVAIDGTGIDYTGDTVTVHGRDLTVCEVRKNYTSYPAWLAAKGLDKLGADAYFNAIVKAENPTLDPASLAFTEAKKAVMAAHEFDYLDYYYEHFISFLTDRYFFERDLDLFILCEKGVLDMKYAFMSEGNDYYAAVQYKALHGRYPTAAELEAAESTLPELYGFLKQNEIAYEEDFYASDTHYFPLGGALYLLSRADYIAASRQLGVTTLIAPTEENVEKEGLTYTAVEQDVYVDGMGYYSYLYTVVHSADPEKTAAFLAENFGDIQTGHDYLPAILTPDDVFEGILSAVRNELIAGFIAMGAVLVLMSVCMYFIMRSSLMNRVKEIGIWRAIGVSKRNLVFRFFVEALVLTALTVLVGYLVTCAFVGIALSLSPLVAEIFFFPPWLALVDLAVLAAVSLLCGTLPILLLLRRTPAEILAKYDI